MIILGIDPGTEIAGYGLLESNGTRHRFMECGAIRLPSRKALPVRLGILAASVRKIISENPIEALAMEDLFFAINVKSALRLAHARGVVMLCAAEKGIPVFEYSPLEVKSSVTGYGRAEKQQVQEMVRVILKLEQPPSPFDASDALAVAICHAQKQSTRQAMQTASQL
jgi:crossover junction endodeoxyribonuclease RuvC